VDSSRLSFEVPYSPHAVAAEELIAASMHPGKYHDRSTGVEMGQ
jgi:hypothetical protein